MLTRLSHTLLKVRTPSRHERMSRWIAKTRHSKHSFTLSAH